MQCYALFIVSSLTYAIYSNLDKPYKTASCQENNWTPLKQKSKFHSLINELSSDPLDFQIQITLKNLFWYVASHLPKEKQNKTTSPFNNISFPFLTAQ